MCYFSSILGITKKLVIKWSSIKSLDKEKKDGIKVNKDTGDSVVFSGFSERDTSLKFIKRLWSNNSSYADNIDSDDDDEDDEADDLLNQARENASNQNSPAKVRSRKASDNPDDY